MILLPCRLAGSKPKQLTRPYVVEKREAGLERYGTAWPQTLLCLALSRLPTHPSHTRHPVLQYLCCLFVCVYIYLFFRVISESVFSLSLSLHWLSTSAVTLAVHTRWFTLYLGTNNQKKKKVYCGVFELYLKVFENDYDSFCCVVCTAGLRYWITSG